MAKSRPAETIYTLKISLAHIRPLIWRRIETPDLSLAQLHTVIQACFNWGSYHMWEFRVKQTSYSSSVFELDELEMEDASRITLAEVAAAGVKKFVYNYDFGDDWKHEITIGRKLTAKEGVRYPRCVAGENAGPPEDCGGAFGYSDFVEAVTDPTHSEHETMLEWIGGSFDPTRFDLDGINQALARSV